MLDLYDAFLLTDDADDLARTWEAALVARPGRIVGPAADDKLPVVLHMHGAYGIGECEEVMAAISNELGFAFVAPDSFARKFRRSNCIAGTIESGTFPPADIYRRAEILHAFSELKKTDWVDANRIILSGYSEGGEAVAVWGHLVPCCAAIVTAWSCCAPAEWNWADGLRLRAGLPILQVIADGDLWFDRPGWHPALLEARESFEQVIVAGSMLHEVYRLEAAQQAYRTFMRKLGKPEDGDASKGASLDKHSG